MAEKMTRVQAAEIYNTLAKAHKLPSVDAFDNEFELLDSLRRFGFEPSFPLRFIRRSMLDKFYTWTNYFHGYIQPSQQSIILMQEYGHFSEKERKEILEYLRQIMVITRDGAALDLITDDKKDAAFIADSFTKWVAIKHELQKYIHKTVAGWKKPIKDEEFEPTGM